MKIAQLEGELEILRGKRLSKSKFSAGLCCFEPIVDSSIRFSENRVNFTGKLFII